MSWQATAWAEKQKTGSPARKALLLVLGNYADEDGYCWPSQETLAEGCEQSVDSVHRNSKRLEAAGLITIEKKERRGGRWPRLAYRLLMTKADPQKAVRQESNTGAQCGSADPHPERSPIRIENGHRSAQLCGMNLQSNSQNNNQVEPSAVPQSPHRRRLGEHGDFRSPKERRWQQAFDNVERALGLANNDREGVQTRQWTIRGRQAIAVFRKGSPQWEAWLAHYDLTDPRRASLMRSQAECGGVDWQEQAPWPPEICPNQKLGDAQ